MKFSHLVIIWMYCINLHIFSLSFLQSKCKHAVMMWSSIYGIPNTSASIVFDTLASGQAAIVWLRFRDYINMLIESILCLGPVNTFDIFVRSTYTPTATNNISSKHVQNAIMSAHFASKSPFLVCVFYPITCTSHPRITWTRSAHGDEHTCIWMQILTR